MSVHAKAAICRGSDEPFTIENQQLTPSLKMKRHVLREVYGARLEGLYKRSA